MEQVYMTKGEVDGQKETLLTKEGTLLLLGFSGFREFEKTPRKRARAALNILFHKAGEKGYSEKDQFIKDFKAYPGSTKDRHAAVAGLGKYVDLYDVLAAFRFVDEIK
jgi:hypothetical protein